MVHFLVQRGADIHAKTGKELQTPIHFAARNDATSSLKMLMKCGACITDKDFKQRTALQVCTNDWRQFSMLIRFCRKKMYIGWWVRYYWHNLTKFVSKVNISWCTTYSLMFTARRHEIVTYSGKHNDRLGDLIRRVRMRKWWEGEKRKKKSWGNARGRKGRAKMFTNWLCLKVAFLMRIRRVDFIKNNVRKR